MANVQNTLTTVLRLVGAQQYGAQLNTLAQAHQQLAAAAGAAPAGGGFLGLGGTAGTLALTAGLAAIGALVAEIRQGTEAFAGFELAATRADAILQNMGHQSPFGTTAARSLELSQQLGVSPTQLADLQGYLARFRMSGQDMQRTMKVVTDASRMTGASFRDMAHLIEMARFGKGRQALGELGIYIHAAGGQMLSLDQVLTQVESRVRGGAAVYGTTLAGAMERAGAAVERLQIAFGKAISPDMVKIFHLIANAADYLAAHIDTVTAALRGMIGAIFPPLAAFFMALDKVPNQAAAAAAAAGDSGSRSEAYLREIAFNTGPQGPMGHALGHGGGSFETMPGGMRIRDYNAMVRRVR